MSQPDRIEQDIEVTRARLASTNDQLVDRAAAQARDQVGPLGIGPDEIDLEAGGLQQARQVLLRRPLIPGRVDGVHPHKVLQDGDRLRLERAGHGARL